MAQIYTPIETYGGVNVSPEPILNGTLHIELILAVFTMVIISDIANRLTKYFNAQFAHENLAVRRCGDDNKIQLNGIVTRAAVWGWAFLYGVSINCFWGL